MADDARPFYAPDLKPAERRSVPAEPLFAFRTGDHSTWRVELRHHGTWGSEALFYRDLEFSRARMFATRELAIQWAEEERRYLERRLGAGDPTP